MSWWDSFTSAISTAGSVGKNLTGGGDYLNEDEKKRKDEFNTTVKNALSDVDKMYLEVNPLYKYQKAALKSTADILLKHVAVPFIEKVYSPLMRGIGTVGVLADQTSSNQLYKKGQFEEGFQFSDIKAAWNRTEKVTAFQALSKSIMVVPIVGSYATIGLEKAGINLNEVDLWSDESLKENFTDNAVGRWFTGIGDFFLGAKGLSVAGKVAGKAVKAAAKPAGLYTKGKTVDALATDMETGILHASTNGLQGAQTVSGSQVLLLAQTRDWSIVEDIVSKYSTNEKLIPIIREASDANAVKDLLLADKGNMAAWQRLATGTSSHHLFDIADVKSQLRNKMIEAGRTYLPSKASAVRLSKVFDDAIKSDPQFVKIKNAFFDDAGDITYGGKAYMPIEPIFGASTLVKLQRGLLRTRSAIRSRDYSKVSGFVEAAIGETAGGLVIRGLKKVGPATDALPAGFVSLSGMRPLQARMEFTGFINNMKMFKNGDDKIMTGFAGGARLEEKVSVVRARLEDEFMNSLGRGQIAQVEALKSIDAQIGKMLAYKAGKFNQLEIDGYVAKFQMNVSKGMESIRNNGFAIGYDGNVTLVNPQTVRDLAESYRFTPWNQIERQLNIDAAKGAKKVGLIVARGGRDIFAELNKIWTFDALARPSYAFKQSQFEPLISTSLALGTNFVRKEIIVAGSLRTSKNWYNFAANAIQKNVINRAEYKAVVDNVSDRSLMLQEAIAAKNFAEASVDDLIKNASPATRSQHLSAARKELKVIEDIVDKIELDLRDAMVPYGATKAMPSIVTLARRIAYLEANPGITKKTAQIKAAKTAMNNYKKIISKMPTNKKIIMDADDAVQKAYDVIDSTVKELGEAIVKKADVFGKSEKFKARYYSKEKHTFVVNGAQHHIDSFIQEQSDGSASNFTAAVLAETKNAKTQMINFLGEKAAATALTSIRRKIPLSKIGVADENYFKELAYIANRNYRGDKLMDRIFAEQSPADIIRWGKTPEGRAYLKPFDVFDTEDIAPYITEKIDLVKRMYPSYEARAAIVKGEVTATQLEKTLAPYVNELYDIIPSNHNYGASSFGMGTVGKIALVPDKVMNKYMSVLASVENPIRAQVFEKFAVENVARKAAYLMEQGVDMTTGQWNAIRQSSGREALEQMEKTLYTVNNPNRLINSLRVVTAFPGANANAFLRYGRLAAKNPVRTANFVSNYGRAYLTFGVDESGNPTDDIDKMTHLIVPGAKEAAKIIPGVSALFGEEAKLNAQSLGFLLNRPGPSFVTGLTVGQLMQKFHKTEKEVEELMTWDGTNWYKVIFPYGAPTSIKDVYTPAWLKSGVNSIAPYSGWQRDVANLIFGKSGQNDYLSSWKSVYNYNAMLVEMGIQDEMPSDAEIEKQVKGLFRAKFLSTWASPFAGIPYKIDSNPMSLTSNLYWKLIQKYTLQGLSNDDARAAAGDEMINTLGPQFMVDRVSFVGSNKNLNFPATSEAYARIMEDNDELVGVLANIDPDNIGLVGLLTSDLDYDPLTQSSNILKLLSNQNATLPGTSKNLNDLKMTPQEIEKERLTQRTWNDYMVIKTALENKITDGKTLRAHPELKIVLDSLAVGVLRNQSEEWYNQLQLAESGDTSYKYAKGLSAIINNEKFMAKHGNSQYWMDVKEFLDSRTIFVKMYQLLPDYDPRKKQLMDNYNAWIKENVGQWDGNLKTIITRYFDNDSLKAVN
jgi:hypothetical protein